jgi:hypothetical protein
MRITIEKDMLEMVRGARKAIFVFERKSALIVLV